MPTKISLLASAFEMKVGAGAYETLVFILFALLFFTCIFIILLHINLKMYFVRLFIYLFIYLKMFLSLENDLQSMEEIKELLRNVQLILKAKIWSTVREGNVLENVEMDDWNVVDKFNCGVSGLTGSCCRQIDILTFHEKCK